MLKQFFQQFLPRRKPFRNLNRSQQLAKGPIDLPFLALVLLLLGIGLIMLLSASSYSSLYDKAAGYSVSTDGVVTLGSPYYYFERQAIFAVFGLIVMFVVSMIDYQNFRKYGIFVLGIAICLLVLVLFPFLGVQSNGARRWLRLLLFRGPTYQPSEIAKLGVVLFFAAGFSRRKKRRNPHYIKNYGEVGNVIRHFAYWSDLVEIFPYLCILGIISFLMILEPHFSGTILILVAGASIMFVAGIRLGWFVLGLGGMGALFYLLVFVIGYNSSRIQVWLDPWSDASDSGYQIVQSIYAVASGGLTGLGFGQSHQKYLYLPEEQNDFIFAIICEELGFIGAVLIILLFALLVIRGYWLAIHARDKFGTLLIVGFTTVLAVQVFLNIAVVLNLTPATGISLPFFSYGGTALVIQLAEIGVILSVSRQIAPYKE